MYFYLYVLEMDICFLTEVDNRSQKVKQTYNKQKKSVSTVSLHNYEFCFTS